MWALVGREALREGVDALDPTPVLRPSMLGSTPDSSLQAIIGIVPSVTEHL